MVRDLTLLTADHGPLVKAEVDKESLASSVGQIVPPASARQIHTLLMSALNASIDADRAEVRWVNTVLLNRAAWSHGSQRFQFTAQAAVDAAGRARTTFLDAYNVFRTKSGVPPIPAGMIF